MPKPSCLANKGKSMHFYTILKSAHYLLGHLLDGNILIITKLTLCRKSYNYKFGLKYFDAKDDLGF